MAKVGKCPTPPLVGLCGKCQVQQTLDKMKLRIKKVLAALATALGGAAATAACVTSGSPISEYPLIKINDPITRLVWQDERGDYAGVIFTFQGNSGEVPAASGAILRQLGLRLHVRDDCNAMYIMWPSVGGELGVSVKSNPLLMTSKQCGAKGYIKQTPTLSRTVAPLVNGARYWFEATYDDPLLVVRVNGAIKWMGTVDVPFIGNPGFRTDNVNVNINWLGNVNDIGRSNLRCVTQVQ